MLYSSVINAKLIIALAIWHEIHESKGTHELQ